MAHTTESQEGSRTKIPEIVETSQRPLAAIRGVFFAVALGFLIILSVLGIKSCKAERDATAPITSAASTESASDHTPAVYEDPEYPSTGTGFVKKGTDLKIWLDPQKSRTRGMKPVKYTLEGHPTVVFEDDFSGKKNREWWKFPPGKYIVSTSEEQEVYFRWCTECSSL